MAEEQKPMGDKSAGQRATCQLCGGEIAGWMCQSCEAEFEENDAGVIVLLGEAAPTSEWAGSGTLSTIMTWYGGLPVPAKRALSLANLHQLSKALARPAVSQAGGQAPTGGGDGPDLVKQAARMIRQEFAQKNGEPMTARSERLAASILALSAAPTPPDGGAVACVPMTGEAVLGRDWLAADMAAAADRIEGWMAKRAARPAVSQAGGQAPTFPPAEGAVAWRDISTAPKDDSWFIARQDGQTYPCQWLVIDNEDGPPSEGWWDFFNQSFEEPTEWCPAAPTSPPEMREGETWESIAAWQRETFGPVELARQAQRAAEEMDELLADPSDVEEAADVCIVLAGYPGIRDAINRKMAKNRSRQWRLNGDGTGYHVKHALSTQEPDRG